MKEVVNVKKFLKIVNCNLSDLFKVLVGSFLFCFAINMFIVPNNLYTGGILGFAQLVRSLITGLLHLNISFDFSGILYYVINIPLFILAYRSISKSFFYKTIFAVSIQSILLSLLPIPNDPVVDDLLVNVLIGGVIGGFGIGLTLSSGASTGGTDIIGLALAKKNNDLSVGKLGMFVNFIIYLIAGCLYGIEIMIYSIIYSVVDNLMIDKTHEQNICSTAFIFCKSNPRKINEFIKNDLNRDFTYWNAAGGYDDSKTYIIYTVLTKYELIRLEKYIKNNEFNAFMVKSEGIGIKGEFEKNF